MAYIYCVRKNTQASSARPVNVDFYNGNHCNFQWSYRLNIAHWKLFNSVNAILPKSQCLMEACNFQQHVISKYRNVFRKTLAEQYISNSHFKPTFFFLLLNKNQNGIFELFWNKMSGLISNNLMLTTSFPRNFLGIGGEKRLLSQILTNTTVFSVGTSGRIKIPLDRVRRLLELASMFRLCFFFHLSTFH